MSGNRDYNLQCLLELLAAAINGEDIPEWQIMPDWEALYKMADYHNVANTIYGLILGMDRRGLARWKKLFDERFHFSVINQEKYDEVSKDIRKAMEKAKIHIMELEEAVMNRCYRRREQRYPLPINYLVEEGKTEELQKVMAKLGFEKKENVDLSKTMEIRFRRPGSVDIVFVEKLFFTNKKMSKYFSLPPNLFQKKRGFKYVHVQNGDDFYLYYVAHLAEKYARGAAELRDVMDLWQYYRLCYNRVNWREVNKELRRMELDRFGTLIVKLAAMWFGYRNPGEEDAELILAMEKYIASKGTKCREESETLLPLVKEVADIYARDLRKERRKKLMELWFPDRHYMEKIYPVLEKRPWFLPFCWMARLVGRQYRKVKRFFAKYTNMIYRGVKKAYRKVKKILGIPIGKILKICRALKRKLKKLRKKIKLQRKKT